jgi:hypothetical protein
VNKKIANCKMQISNLQLSSPNCPGPSPVGGSGRPASQPVIARGIRNAKRKQMQEMDRDLGG